MSFIEDSTDRTRSGRQLRPGAWALFGAGLLLALSAPWLYGGERWVLDDPDRPGHITALAAGNGQTLYAGNQSGNLLQRRDGRWTTAGTSPGEQAILGLFPEHGLAMTTQGVWDWREGRMLSPPGSPRVSHVLPVEGGLLVGTGNGILLRAEGEWRDGALQAQVYRLQMQSRTDVETLHVGTIADGVWSLPVGDVGQDGAEWRQNNQGLPKPVNVLSLLTAGNDALLAGTDQGLFWQASDSERWRRVDAGLGTRRILALGRSHVDDTTILWAGSDDGVYQVRLVERERTLETQGRWEEVNNPPGGLDQSVSWVVPLEENVWIAAGSLYRLGSPRDDRWMLQLGAGLFLAAVGLYRLRKH
ncbi:MAG: hypothetical protein JJU06_20650 [Ectothiorhodospiraceae bacterium]|nr:hypothetical protein [Ectothiorhodospiraceae bacterium]MCH8504781.1 hypothetical protein [Ectothiorhodospiraceae bacterium]